MNNDIKEMLDNMKEISSFEYTTDWFELNYEDTKILLDYITNLQEENKRLLKIKKYAEEVGEKRNELYERIDKAIEYIKENADYGIQEKCCMNDLNYDECDILLNILQGGE